MIITDAKYVLMLSGRLVNFRQKSDYHFLFNCPFCSDNVRKGGRGSNIFRASHTDRLRFFCFRCGESLSVQDFLKRLDPHLAEEHRKECRTPWFYRYTQPVKIEPPQAPAYEPGSPSILAGLPSIEDLPDNHPAKAYIVQRQIPTSFHSLLFWAEDFAAAAQKLRPDGSYSKLVSEPRIVIPFLDGNRNILALQGRSIDSQVQAKYITVKVHENAPKIFGLDRHVKGQPSYVTEGPFDAMFLPNCLAIAGSDLACPQIPKDAVLIFDNEPRKRQTIERMLKAAEDGFVVCVWPECIVEKDVNEMVMSGRTPERVKQIIDENVFKGRTLIRNVNYWKRVDVPIRRYNNHERQRYEKQ